MWLEVPDAAAPLIFAIPFFGLTIGVRGGGVHLVDFAALLGVIGAVGAVVALFKKENGAVSIFARTALGTSALLFVLSSRPMWESALTALPFCVVLLWPWKKQNA